MLPRAIHYVLAQYSDSPGEIVSYVPCGTQAMEFWPTQLTSDINKVTCRRCLKNIEERKI